MDTKKRGAIISRLMVEVQFVQDVGFPGGCLG